MYLDSLVAYKILHRDRLQVFGYTKTQQCTLEVITYGDKPRSLFSITYVHLLQNQPVSFMTQYWG